ncbi:hypothetical protein TNCV_2834461 [Trichonephila clavipes]|nr:hypothetical protein TNCV_2834461 [Trichonephila clavipes]
MMPLLCVSQVLNCGNSICHEGFKHKLGSFWIYAKTKVESLHSSSRGIVTLFTGATLLLLATSFTVEVLKEAMAFFGSLRRQLVDPADLKTPKSLHEDIGSCDYRT